MKEQSKEQEIKKQIAEILRANIHFSPQLQNYVVHGAIEAIWKLMQGYAQSAPKQSAGVDLKKLEERFDKLFETETEETFNAWLKKEKNMENKLAGVWVKASELKEIDWPLCIRYDGGGAPYYTTVCSMKELQKCITGFNPITEIYYLDEGQQLQSQQQEIPFRNIFGLIHDWLNSDDVFVTDKKDGKVLPDAYIDCKKGSLLKRLTAALNSKKVEQQEDKISDEEIEKLAIHAAKNAGHHSATFVAYKALFKQGYEYIEKQLIQLFNETGCRNVLEVIDYIKSQKQQVQLELSKSEEKIAKAISFCEELEKDYYPEDIFLPVSKDELDDIDSMLKKKFNMPLDRLTGHIGRSLRKPIIEDAKQMKTFLLSL